MPYIQGTFLRLLYLHAIAVKNRERVHCIIPIAYYYNIHNKRTRSVDITKKEATKHGRTFITEKEVQICGADTNGPLMVVFAPILTHTHITCRLYYYWMLHKRAHLCMH